MAARRSWWCVGRGGAGVVVLTLTAFLAASTGPVTAANNTAIRPNSASGREDVKGAMGHDERSLTAELLDVRVANVGRRSPPQVKTAPDPTEVLSPASFAPVGFPHLSLPSQNSKGKVGLQELVFRRGEQ